jgi:hypothetical protein
MPTAPPAASLGQVQAEVLMAIKLKTDDTVKE